MPVKLIPFKRLNYNASIATNSYVTSPTVRVDAAIRYPTPLKNLHTHTSDVISATIKKYNLHLDQFLDVIEDPEQSPAIKVKMLIFPIEQGMSLLADSAYQQRKAEAPDQILKGMPSRIKQKPLIKDYLNVNFGLAAKAPDSSIVTHSQNEINFKQVLERLCRIAESEEQFKEVRIHAIQAMKLVHQVAVTSFGLNLDREPLNGRMLNVGIKTIHIELTKSALQFADGIYPAVRTPSHP